MRRNSLTLKTVLFGLAMLCVVAFVMFSFAQITDFDHDCYLDCCPVCTAAAVRDNILSAWAIIELLLFSIVLSVYFYSIGRNDEKAKAVAVTPVRLKVKLSN